MKAVIFDMDGVVIDSEPLHIRLEKQIFDELGVTLTEAEHENFLGTSGREMFARIRKRFNLAQTVDELLNDERSRYIQLLNIEGVPFVKGIPELVDKLHQSGIKLAIASSAPHEQIDLVLNSSFADSGPAILAPYFPVRVSGDDLERSKPDPAIFLKAANLLGIAPGDCRVIEDSENGIRAAIAAGMPCIAFNNPGSPPQDLSQATHIINNMKEAAAILLG